VLAGYAETPHPTPPLLGAGSGGGGWLPLSWTGWGAPEACAPSAQVMDAPEACAPGAKVMGALEECACRACRHAPTLPRPRWAGSGGGGWLPLSWVGWARRRRALPVRR
jgi:hypothetical protein